MTTSARRPNLLVILTDDHAAHAISAYGSRVNQTPHLDRLAAEGMRFDNCFCTNSICTPSRASILTGEYSHRNGVRTLFDTLDNTRPQVQKVLGEQGYQSAVVGKWHLGHGPGADPSGFDYWSVLPGQGLYHDPTFLEAGGEVQRQGYVTDLITDVSLDWLAARDPDRPFLLMLNHKAPHRPWQPDEAHADLYDDLELPVPDTFDDDHSGKSEAARDAVMRMADLLPVDLKEAVPAGLTPEQERHWRYQRYIKDYLCCVASVDDNVGRVLDWLDAEGLAEDTVVVYTSDQGFFLGDHGWFDKRFMYEESLRMPLLVRHPGRVPAGAVSRPIVTNVDLAPTLLQLAGIDVPEHMQGHGFLEQLHGDPPAVVQDCAYYRYWEHLSRPHHVQAHLGIRTERHKLIHYLGREPGGPGETLDAEVGDEVGEWELYDLEADPGEMDNLIDDPAHAELLQRLRSTLHRKQAEVGDVVARVDGPPPAR